MRFRQLLPEPGSRRRSPELLAASGAWPDGLRAERPVHGRQLRRQRRTAGPRSRVARARSATTATGRCSRRCASEVDAVLVGTGTLRAERYGRMLPDSERRERRAASGD